jgi:hypothetical protein
MSYYTNQQLQSRREIIDTHKQFCNFLDAKLVNKLVHLFESNIISKYIEDERIFQGMNTSNVIITSNVDIEGKDGPSLYLNIKKHNLDYIHLSIHLCIKDLEPAKQGIVHMVKNVFKNPMRYTNISKSKLRKLKPRMYALIGVRQSTNNPNSLEFTIEDEYLTTDISGANTNESQLQQEMKAILKVLNRLFKKEKTKYYIGRKEDMINVHNKTNKILTSMNTYTKYATRKNYGVLLGPRPSNQPTLVIKRNRNRNRKTRKAHPIYNNLRKRTNTLQEFIDADINYQEPESHESDAA